MINNSQKEKIEILISKVKSDYNSSKSVDYLSDEITKADKKDIKEILLNRTLSGPIFNLFLWGYSRFGDQDLVFLESLFENYLYEPNKLGPIIGLLLRINRRGGNFETLLEQAFTYYYNKYKRFGSPYFKNQGGIGFIFVIIIAIGEFRVIKAMPLLKKINHDLILNEPNLSRAAGEAIEKIEHEK